jgi:hypothetical protein
VLGPALPEQRQVLLRRWVPGLEWNCSPHLLMAQLLRCD